MKIKVIPEIYNTRRFMMKIENKIDNEFSSVWTIITDGMAQNDLSKFIVYQSRVKQAYIEGVKRALEKYIST